MLTKVTTRSAPALPIWVGALLLAPRRSISVVCPLQRGCRCAEAIASPPELMLAPRTLLFTTDGDLSALASQFKRLDPVASLPAASRQHEIPVRYDGEDLLAVATECGMTPQQVVAALAGVEYVVVLLGFARGFPLPVRTPGAAAAATPSHSPHQGAGRLRGDRAGPVRHLPDGLAGWLAATGADRSSGLRRGTGPTEPSGHRRHRTVRGCPVVTRLRVVSSGPYACFQDQGRHGRAHQGSPVWGRPTVARCSWQIGCSGTLR